MSDQSPPPKPKPSSLRDRIAAFENKAAPGPTTSGPPPPRPKPSGLQWKPRAPSPPASSEHVPAGEKKPTSTTGMSVSDAMESIGRGGSLRERMAALQGKGAFGGPPPPVAPKPNVERPKWKPPPSVPAPEEGIAPIDEGVREASRSPPPRAVASPAPGNQTASNHEGDAVVQEGEGGDPDQEEEERQRRAAIAARMARLGGAHFGMGPPIFAPKPVVRKPEPAPSTDEVTNPEAPTDLPTVAKESREALVTSPPPDLPPTTSPVPEAATTTEHKDEAEEPLPMPARIPASMPVPAGPRRAAPPRKKASKNAPAAPLPQPPVEEVEVSAVQSTSVIDEPHKSTIYDAPLAEVSQKDTREVVEAIETTHDEHMNITTGPEPFVPGSTEEINEPVETPSHQEAVEEPAERAIVHAEEESMHTTAEDQAVQPSGAVEPEADEDEADEEARRQRVAARLAQMGAFNPLAGPPPIPQRSSFDEQAVATSSKEALDVEDEVNVDTEEYGETISPPPTPPARQDTVPPIEHDVAEPDIGIDQDDVKVDEDNQAPAHRDVTGEHAVASFNEVQGGGGHDGHGLPCSESSEESPIQDGSVYIVARQEQGTDSVQQADALVPSGTALPVEEERQDDRLGEGAVADSTTTDAQSERDTSKALKDDEEADEMPPPRITRPIPPPPPPVNLRSKPTAPSSPPIISSPPKTPVQALRTEEEERAASPDIPPRPVPPPVRSGSITEDAPSPPPRRSMPPPPRRTPSVRVSEPQAEAPSSPPPAPTSPRPVNSRRPDAPPIILTQEQSSSDALDEEHAAEEETSANVTPRPESPEDEAAARRRAIAERMARLGGIRFGAPPLMDPLSRPPLPSAPPPTSIPPDDTESEDEAEDERREEEEEDELARKQRITAKLAGMGGMRLGMLPPTLPPVRRRVSKSEESESDDAVLPVPVPAPSQRAPPTRKPPPPIDSPLEQVSGSAGSGSRRTSSDDGVRVEAEESEIEEVRYSDAEVPLASEEENPPTLPPPHRASHGPRSADALPTPPPAGRPPIPTIPAGLLGRRPSGKSGTGSMSASSSRQASVDETQTMSGRARPPSEYVLVEAEDREEYERESLASAPKTPPPRRSWSVRSPVRSVPLPPPPPPSAVDPLSEALAGSAQWELPTVGPGTSFGEGSETMASSSGWSEDSTAVVHVPPPTLPGTTKALGKMASLSSAASSSLSGYRPGSGSGMSGSVSGSASSGLGRRSSERRRAAEPQLTTDELMTIWGKVGVQVVEAATALFEKSKRTLVGDGSYAGFVRAVLAQVPRVVVPAIPAATDASVTGGNDNDSEDDNDWGYVVYSQTGSTVQRRVSDIMPGDVIAFWDAKFKGHKGLHSYTQTVGGGGGGHGELTSGAGGHGPLVGIVSEFDGKKSKVKAWQANQHVGQQTVENVSYRLEDLKSGQVKVYRVLQA